MGCFRTSPLRMNRLRHPDRDPVSPVPRYPPRLLRIVASGTLFLTHTLTLSSHPAPASVTRAHAVNRTRGGGVSVVLKTLVQLGACAGEVGSVETGMGPPQLWIPRLVDAQLVAPLAGNEEGRTLMRELESDGVSLRHCKVWERASVPTAWVLHAVDTATSSVINHNPLPEITHEEFVSLLGPLLAPENYTLTVFNPGYPSPSASPIAVHPAPIVIPGPPSPRPSPTAARIVHHPYPFQGPVSPSSPSMGPGQVFVSPIHNSPAPFDWLHFEGRSFKTTLNNMVGIDGLARERKWRRHCVFSIDLGRKAKIGAEILMPHADVIFVSHHYARSLSSSAMTPPTSPRSFLLSLLAHAPPPHALLVTYWGRDGGAALSVPTREYFQSSAWIPPRVSAPTSPSQVSKVAAKKTGVKSNHVNHSDSKNNLGNSVRGHPSVGSVRSASDFYAGLDPSTCTAGDSVSLPRADNTTAETGEYDEDEEEEEDDGTEQGHGEVDMVDEAGAHDAFASGMIFALSRRLLPGPPWTPGSAGSGEGGAKDNRIDDGDRWRLDECLRFATELAGRKARRKRWDGLAREMMAGGWFE